MLARGTGSRTCGFVHDSAIVCQLLSFCLGSSARASASVAWDVERLGKATSSINLFGAIRNMDGPDADK